jgi:hypothetical protein
MVLLNENLRNKLKHEGEREREVRKWKGADERSCFRAEIKVS